MIDQNTSKGLTIQLSKDSDHFLCGGLSEYGPFGGGLNIGVVI